MSNFFEGCNEEMFNEIMINEWCESGYDIESIAELATPEQETAIIQVVKDFDDGCIIEDFSLYGILETMQEQSCDSWYRYVTAAKEIAKIMNVELTISPLFQEGLNYLSKNGYECFPCD